MENNKNCSEKFKPTLGIPNITPSMNCQNYEGGSRQVQKNNHEFKHSSDVKSSKLTSKNARSRINRSHLMSEVKNFHCMVQASSGESYKPHEEDLISDSSSDGFTYN